MAYAASILIDAPGVLEAVLELYRFSAIHVTAIASSPLHASELRMRFDADNVNITSACPAPKVDVCIFEGAGQTIIYCTNYLAAAILLPPAAEIASIRDAVAEALCIPLLVDEKTTRNV